MEERGSRRSNRRKKKKIRLIHIRVTLITLENEINCGLKNVFWDVTPFGWSKKRRSEGI
jgi:ribosomal protein L32